MAIWLQTLEISDIFAGMEEGTITGTDGLKDILFRFKNLSCYSEKRIENYRQSIVNEIEALICVDNTFEDVDYVLTMLYDFGDTVVRGETHFDTAKACWIKTLF